MSRVKQVKSLWAARLDRLNDAVARSPVGYYFKLQGSGHPLERKGAVFSVELRAGLVTFAAMAYIISVNASILSLSGGPCVKSPGVADAVAYATCKQELQQDFVTATSAISTLATGLMGLLANMPLGLAPGLGVNAYFALTIVGMDGQGLIPYGQALAAVFLEGWIFFFLSILGLRQWLTRLMPRSITLATGAGIGMYLALIGLGPNGLSVVGGNYSDLLGLGGCPDEYKDDNGYCQSHLLQSPKVWLGVFLGGILTGLLLLYRVKGAFLWPIILVSIASWPRSSAVTEFPHDNGGQGDLGFDFFKKVATWHSFKHLGAENIDFNYGSGKVWLALISILYVDITDVSGTLFAMARHAGLLDEVLTGDFEGSSAAYLVDSFCISIGALFGLSPSTAFIESASGIAEGGRTGLTAISTSFFFFLSLFFAPIFASLPSWATGSTLVIVGSLMMRTVTTINWDYPGDAIPAFLVIAGIPFFFNIAYGLIAAIISWILLHNIPLLLSKIHPSLKPPGWDTEKEPYDVAGSMRGQKFTFKTLLPPYAKKIVEGNWTFWRPTEEEMQIAIEGRRLTQERNALREEQRQRDRRMLREQQRMQHREGVDVDTVLPRTATQQELHHRKQQDGEESSFEGGKEESDGHQTQNRRQGDDEKATHHLEEA